MAEMSGEKIQKFAIKAVNKNTKLLKVKTTKTFDVAESLDVKRLLRMQTPAYVFRTVTK